MSSFTTNKNLEKPANGEYVNTWNVPLNTDMNIIDAALGAVTSLNATSGSANLTSTQYANLAISVTGAMSANVVYTIPNGVGGFWIVRNTTTDATGGPWTTIFQSGGGGTNVTALRDKNIVIWSDGTNIRAVGTNTVDPGTTGTGPYVLQDSPTLTGNVTFSTNSASFTGNVAINSTTAITLPAGTTAQRPNGTTGMFRYNTNNSIFEGYFGTAWGAIGGAVGGGSDQIFYLNGKTVNFNYTIPSSQNAMSTGPIVIQPGVTVTVPAGAVWKVI